MPSQKNYALIGCSEKTDSCMGNKNNIVCLRKKAAKRFIICKQKSMYLIVKK